MYFMESLIYLICFSKPSNIFVFLRKESKLKVVYRNIDEPQQLTRYILFAFDRALLSIQPKGTQCPNHAKSFSIFTAAHTFSESECSCETIPLKKLRHTQRTPFSSGALSTGNVSQKSDEKYSKAKKHKDLIRLQFPERKPRANSMGSCHSEDYIQNTQKRLSTQKRLALSLSSKSLDERRLIPLANNLNDLDDTKELLEYSNELEWDLHQEVVERIRDIGAK